MGCHLPPSWVLQPLCPPSVVYSAPSQRASPTGQLEFYTDQLILKCLLNRQSDDRSSCCWLSSSVHNLLLWSTCSMGSINSDARTTFCTNAVHTVMSTGSSLCVWAGEGPPLLSPSSLLFIHASSLCPSFFSAHFPCISTASWVTSGILIMKPHDDECTPKLILLMLLKNKFI